ncbi:putative RNA-directed DNA polymerase [Rosa chinensis]|uniref:Putative RNA-directed DNA polymerase n=1 Tax=Rosa chinensis TaxID=74649 RepID=A0A2P6S157_ROSCH|nr:putative RNA-directed DNA polymerase [Rosa chinensis]
MCDLHAFIPSPPLIHCDNMSSIALGSNAVFHSKIKSLETDYHFVRERVQKGGLELRYIPTKEQTADIMTKGLHGPQFNSHFGKLRLGKPSCV